MTATPTDRPLDEAVQHQPRARINFSDPEYRRLVRTMCCTFPKKPADNASDDEFAAFMIACERLQLDPLMRQVYFMKRGRDDDAARIGRPELSIDAYRLVAERTGDYCGQTPPQWARVKVNAGDATIVWYDVWPFKGEPPYACRIGVYRRGFAEPLFAIGRYDAYVQTKYGGDPNAMWAKRGPEQLAKCTESLALRQSFPNELGGVYTVDEMAQADSDETPAATNGNGKQQPGDRHPRAVPARNTTRRNTGTAAPAPARAAAPPPADPPPPAAAPVELHPSAVPREERTEARAAGVTWFPYGALAFVPLRMRDETRPGEYVVTDELLAEAEQRVSAAHKDAVDKGETERAGRLERTLGELADEMARRADETAIAAASEPGYAGRPGGAA